MPASVSVSPDASPEEAAAIAAAIQRFLADTTVVAVEAEPQVSGWLRAALHEAVGSRDEHAIW